MDLEEGLAERIAVKLRKAELDPGSKKHIMNSMGYVNLALPTVLALERKPMAWMMSSCVLHRY